MMKKIVKYLFGLSCLCLVLATGIPAQAGIKMSFQYVLSDFSGPVSSQWATVAADRGKGEIYTFDPAKNEVRIFADNGMEIFSFGEDGQMYNAADIAVAEDGSIYVLGTSPSGKPITRLNYRGEPVEEIELKNLPADMQGFKPSKMEYAGGALYLLDGAGLRILVVSREGLYQKGYALRNQLLSSVGEQDAQGKKAQDFQISGFSVDNAGNIYFTAPLLSAAYRLNAGGTLESFGKAGSGPGKFGVVAGIAADSNGNIFVSDRLRSVVMAFDASFNLLTEFGWRGYDSSNLVVPDEVVVDNDKVYVSQGAGRGVSCFLIRQE